MKALAQWEKGGYRMQGDRQRGLEKSPAQDSVISPTEKGRYRSLVRKKIKKIPRLQFRDFEWNKEQLETIESSLAS